MSVSQKGAPKGKRDSLTMEDEAMSDFFTALGDNEWLTEPTQQHAGHLNDRCLIIDCQREGDLIGDIAGENSLSPMTQRRQAERVGIWPHSSGRAGRKQVFLPSAFGGVALEAKRKRDRGGGLHSSARIRNA